MNPLLFIENDLLKHDMFEVARAAAASGREVYVKTRSGPIRFDLWVRRRS